MKDVGFVMYLIYVDESGDTGMKNGSTRYFALSGFVVHELKWRETLDLIIQFRYKLKNSYGLKLREEIHTADFIHHPGKLSHIPKSLRLHILREVIDFQKSLLDINIINIIVDKQNKLPTDDIFEIAWTTLIQRFDNTLSYRNFPGSPNSQDYGLLVVDQTDEKKLRVLTRKMRRFNPVPNTGGGGYRLLPITMIVEDAVHRNSLHSYFIQLADVNAYFLFQYFSACKYVKKKGGKNFFTRLDPVLCKKATRNNSFGIVVR